MIVEIPDHYAGTLGGAMVHRAAQVINDHGIVPAFLHQFADVWDKGLRYSEDNFWQAVYKMGAKPSVLMNSSVADSIDLYRK